MNGLEEAQALIEQLVAWRRDFHRHPELGLEEHRTAGIVAQTLRELGYQVQTGIAETGVIGLLVNGDGPVIMVRADMDALPIQEENDSAYTSQTPGVMHACGHDAHVAMGLGVATLMAQTRDHWQGTLKLVFQPGEEGRNGAEIMVREGALENPRPERMLAIHVWNDLETGQVGVTPGPIMAAAEAWRATITGRGGHAAVPEKAVDPLVAAAQIVMALQTVVSRNVGALDTAVVTVGAFKSGEAFNVIPDQAILEGTMRTYTPEVRATVIRRVREIIEGVATVMGCEAHFETSALTAAVVNDAAMTALVQEVVTDLLGPQQLIASLRTMGSEDASFFMQEVPGCFFFIGSTPPGAQPVAHHNPHFDTDEAALPIGVGVLVEALRRLMPVRGADAAS